LQQQQEALSLLQQEVSEISFQQQENSLQHPENSLQQQEAFFAAARDFVCSSKRLCLQQQETLFAATRDFLCNSKRFLRFLYSSKRFALLQQDDFFLPYGFLFMISVCLCVFFFWLQHFAASGFPCPKLRNPADHFLRAVNSDFDQVKMGVQGSFKIRVRRNDFKFHTLIIEADYLKIVFLLTLPTSIPSMFFL
jgi:hypothetical protein